jgi:hypothetical protein
MTRESREREARSTADKTLAAAENLPTNLRGKRDAPRQDAGDLDLILSVPAGTIPEGFTGHWFKADRVAQKLAEWWLHVTDTAGNNITRTHRDTTLYLMALETSDVEKLDQLRERRYRASIGETEAAAFEGREKGRLEDYMPSGNTFEIKKDIFAGLGE